MKDNSTDVPRILIVDDNRDNLKVVSEFLRNENYRCTIASSGFDVFERITHSAPSMILLDVKMPDVDGFEVCRRLKENSETRDIPVIFLTALEDIESKKKAFVVGGVDFISKPLQKEELLARVKTHLENYLYKSRLEDEVQLRTNDLQKEISRRKEIEAQIRVSLQEKEVLLREIHHRVKNNLSIIQSFLFFQEQGISEEKIRRMFTDTRQRIVTMALVHEKLYQSSSIKDISLQDYFEQLSTSIVENYGLAEKIVFEYDIDSLSLSINLLIPIGLIVNEIVTNSCKYAFDDNPQPRISITCKIADDNIVSLEVSDNGKGFSVEKEMGNKDTFGLNIIHGLTEQIKGSSLIESDSIRGTLYRILIPLDL